MKIKFTASFLMSISFVGAMAQPTLVQGNEMPFTFKKQPSVLMLPNGDGASFVFKSKDYSWPFPTLVNVASNGSVTQVGEIRYQQGVMGNMTDMLNVHSLNGKIIMLFESRNKGANTNRLIARTIDAKGVLGTEEKEVGNFAFEKMGKSGDWYTCVTPDGKHLAIIGQVPAEKETLIQFKYYFLDEDLKAIGSGQFTFPETMKRQFMNSFYASNKGDFYLIKNEFEKGYRYPVVYKSKMGDAVGTVVSVMPENPKQKFMNYVAGVDAEGDLVIAGYIKDKAFLTVGDDQATGSWSYHMTSGKLNISIFEKPISNATAQGVLFNNGTTFLVGEQLKADRETPTTQQGLAMEENYKYIHNDVLITAFDKDGVKKFDLSTSKKFTGRNFDQDLFPAYGIVNNKLALVYNDTYGKYVPNTSYENYKVPVLVYINNDGLMEAPVHLDKEFQTTRSSYTLYPQFFVAAPTSGIIMLAGNGSSVKGVIIK